MRQGGLRDKIARAVASEGLPGAQPLRSRPAPQTADLVNALAQSLQDIAVRTAEPPPLPPRSRRNGAGSATTTLADPAEPSEMPQILQTRRSETRAAGQDARRSWRIGQTLAPAILVVALAVVAALMFWPTGAVDKIASAAKQAPTVKSASLFSSLAGTEREASTATQRPPLNVEDVILLDRAEAMLLRGEIEGARRLLSDAANGGNRNARFALAETFDPNILAARGMRNPVADASTARTLYAQALAAGDHRAQQRLEGLTPGR